jgi:hypothetical protein
VRHAYGLADTCYGMTGGDLYVCSRCLTRVVVFRLGTPPENGPISARPCGEGIGVHSRQKAFANREMAESCDRALSEIDRLLSPEPGGEEKG